MCRTLFAALLGFAVLRRIVVVPRYEGGGMEYPTLVYTDGSDVATRHEVGHRFRLGL